MLLLLQNWHTWPIVPQLLAASTERLVSVDRIASFAVHQLQVLSYSRCSTRRLEWRRTQGPFLYPIPHHTSPTSARPICLIDSSAFAMQESAPWDTHLRR